MGVQICVDQERLAQFCRKHHIYRLAFFGSVLREDFCADSDVDVLVEFEPDHVPGLAFFAIQEELSELLGYRVDLNTPKFLSRYIREQVLREAEERYVAA
jgi:predicted nucleotidyltransferase